MSGSPPTSSMSCASRARRFEVAAHAGALAPRKANRKEKDHDRPFRLRNPRGQGGLRRCFRCGSEVDNLDRPGVGGARAGRSPAGSRPIRALEFLPGRALGPAGSQPALSAPPHRGHGGKGKCVRVESASLAVNVSPTENARLLEMPAVLSRPVPSVGPAESREPAPVHPAATKIAGLQLSSRLGAAWFLIGVYLAMVTFLALKLAASLAAVGTIDKAVRAGRKPGVGPSPGSLANQAGGRVPRGALQFGSDLGPHCRRLAPAGHHRAARPGGHSGPRSHYCGDRARAGARQAAEIGSGTWCANWCRSFTGRTL